MFKSFADVFMSNGSCVRGFKSFEKKKPVVNSSTHSSIDYWIVVSLGKCNAFWSIRVLQGFEFMYFLNKLSVKIQDQSNRNQNALHLLKFWEGLVRDFN